MAFAVHVQNMGDFVNLRCIGRLVFDEGTNALRAAVLSQKAGQIVLDFSDVEAIDAAGVGTLAALHGQVGDGKRILTIVRPSRQVLQVLRLTKADAVLNLRLDGEAPRESFLRKVLAPWWERTYGV
jgi:anti-anti-sigma factor